jgi:hypothetical protein
VRCFDDRDPWTGATYWKNRGRSFIQCSNEKVLYTNCKKGYVNTVVWPTYSENLIFPDVERTIRTARTGVIADHGTTKKEADSKGEIWQFASSYYHPFVLWSSSDGWLKMRNPYQGRLKKEVSDCAMTSTKVVSLQSNWTERFFVPR